MCLRTKGDRLPRRYIGARHTKNGPKEDTRGSRLVPADHCYRSTPVPRVHRILLILHSELFESCAAPPRPYKKDDPMALGRTPIQGFRNPKIPYMSKTCTPSAKLCETFLPSDQCLCIWRGRHTLAGSRRRRHSTPQKLQTQPTPSSLLLG